MWVMWHWRDHAALWLRFELAVFVRARIRADIGLHRSVPRRSARSHLLRFAACAQGFWKSSTSDASCTACLNSRSTASAGSTSVSACACPPGMSWNGTWCANCALNTFKSSYADSACTPCSSNQVTQFAGQSSSSECVCPPGQLWDGSQCTACAQGQYKSTWDLSASCSACAATFTTAAAGSTSSTACVCAPGQTLVAGSCSDCAVSSFKPSYSTSACTLCSNNLQTQSAGSTSSAQCQCPPGAFLNSSNWCSSCPLATFAPSWSVASSCSSCGNGLTTTATASTSSAACVCAPGQTWSGSACVNCAVNSFKSSYGTGACTLCTSNQVTQSTGATSASACGCADGFFLSAGSCTGERSSKHCYLLIHRSVVCSLSARAVEERLQSSELVYSVFERSQHSERWQHEHRSLRLSAWHDLGWQRLQQLRAQ